MPPLFYYYNELCNYFAIIPGLAKQVFLCTTGNAPSKLWTAATVKAQNLKSSMEEWYSRLLSSFDGDAAAFIKVPSDAIDPLFSTIYIYSSEPVSALICTYCAYLIFINNLLVHLGEGNDYESENGELIRQICMSVEYCAKSGLCGTQSMTFALPIAYNFATEEYRAWIRDSLTKFQGLIDVERFYKEILADKVSSDKSSMSSTSSLPTQLH